MTHLLRRSARTRAARTFVANRARLRRAEVDHLSALDLALVDPHLDPEDPVRRARERGPVVDVRLEGRERHAAFALLRLASHLRAAETAVQLDLDPLGAGLDRRLD